MARTTTNGHVTKICGCGKWKECTHPWYVDYRTGKVVDETGRVKRLGLRAKLATLVGREPVDFADAKIEAARAIVAWKDGRDAREILPGDAPTVTELLDGYGARPGGSTIDKYQRGRIIRTVVNSRPLGDWRGADVTREMIEAFQRERPKVAGNRDLALLKSAFNWAVLRKLVPSTPFKVGTVTAVKFRREEARTRRLYPGEEERLLAACMPGVDKRGGPYAGNAHLHALIIAALETGCRLGELLSMQWWQVSSDLFFPAGKTKAKKPRRVPISSVLRAVLDARRHDPAGDPLPADAFVFGDEIGRRHGSIAKAWQLARERAKVVDLHFHDLRREGPSRWLDAGVPLHVIQKWLGHHNISQTSTYLAATHGGDADAMRAFEQKAGRLQPAPTDLPTSASDEQQPSAVHRTTLVPPTATVH